MDYADIFPIVECYRCGAKTCYQHRVEWHEGYSCKEWDKREERWTREEILSREWIDDQTKRCPGRGCNRPVRKFKGYIAGLTNFFQDSAGFRM